MLESSINFRCRADILSRLTELAEEANQHRSQLMREAVTLLISRYDRRKKIPELNKPAV
jgi:predicted transcriptional regulator